MIDRIKIMTFNIRGTPPQDEINAWENRAPLVTHILSSHEPDLIGFQELQVGNAATFDSELPRYQWSLGQEYNRCGRVMYCASYWQDRKFHRRQAGSFYLSKTPERWSSDWHSARVKVANWIILETVPEPSQNSYKLLHINTHLDHGHPDARLKGAQLILEKLDQVNPDNLPVILTGDFNTSLALNDDLTPIVADPDKPPRNAYDVFIQHGFGDCFVEAGGKDYPPDCSGLDDDIPSFTVHDFEGDRFTGANIPEVNSLSDQISWRIDWILIRDGCHHLEAKSCAIIRDAQPPVYPSDHYPVIADIRICPNA
jgi:endonuclease/exonuclease/phosphatase family metal-dependent hydrolase